MKRAVSEGKMHWLENVRGVLLDVDGTLLRGDRPIEGAVQAVQRLRERGLACRMVTNTTRRASRDTTQVLRDGGFEIEEGEVLMPAVLARRVILDSGNHEAALLVPSGALEDFGGVRSNETDPGWVVLADMGAEFDWDRLNRGFRCVMGGAKLLALQRNPYWDAGDRGLQLDAGALVAALEFATGTTARVVGKPSRDFFDLAIADLGLDASEVLMVGDDLLNDGIGGHEAGCRTALVCTGRFNGESDLPSSGYRPDQIAESIAGLF